MPKRYEKKDMESFIFFNKENKMFFLHFKIGEIYKLTLPGNFPYFEGDKRYEEFLKQIEKVKNNFVFIHNQEIKQNNGNLDNKNFSENNPYNRAFYALYVEDDAIFNQLNDFFSDYGYECFLFSYNELMKIYFGTRNTQVDDSTLISHGVKIACKTLRKKLTYEIY